MIGGLGKMLMVMGGFLVLLGATFVVAGRTHLPVGRLPGDVVYRGKNTVFYFPLMTSILLSVVLSLIFYTASRLHR